MISALLATTGRPAMAERSVRGFIETTDGHDVEIVCAIDNSPETVSHLTTMEYPPRVHLEIDHRREYRGCSRAWNDALRLSTGDPIVLAADDLVWHPGWLEAALDCLAAFPDGWGMVGFNDGHWTDELATHYLLSRRMIIEHFGGRIAWEEYRHSFNDVEANERARRAGRYTWCADARVSHQHWIFGDRPQDATDTRSLPEHPGSEAAYQARRAAGFPDSQPPIIS